MGNFVSGSCDMLCSIQNQNTVEGGGALPSAETQNNNPGGSEYL